MIFHFILYFSFFVCNWNSLSETKLITFISINNMLSFHKNMTMTIWKWIIFYIVLIMCFNSYFPWSVGNRLLAKLYYEEFQKYRGKEYFDQLLMSDIVVEWESIDICTRYCYTWLILVLLVTNGIFAIYREDALWLWNKMKPTDPYKRLNIWV